MSYNISNWTTKRLENFVIPLRALYNTSDDLRQRNWEMPPPRITSFSITDGIFIEVANFGQGEIKGKLLSSSSEFLSGTDIAICEIAVSEICVYGEGSGTTFYNEILLPALRQSRGVLEAVLVWEGGDSISRLIVEDGEVAEESIEL